MDATCPEDTVDMIFMRHRPEGWSHGLGFLRERKSRVSAREEKSGSGLVLVDGRILTRSTRHTNNRYIVAIPFGYRNGSGGRCRWTFDSVGASGEPPNVSDIFYFTALDYFIGKVRWSPTPYTTRQEKGPTFNRKKVTQ